MKLLEPPSAIVLLVLALPLTGLGLAVENRAPHPVESMATVPAWGWPVPLVVDDHDGAQPGALDRGDAPDPIGLLVNWPMIWWLSLYGRGVVGRLRGRLVHNDLDGAAIVSPAVAGLFVAAPAYAIGMSAWMGPPLIGVAVISVFLTVLIGIPLTKFLRRNEQYAPRVLVTVGTLVGGGIAAALELMHLGEPWAVVALPALGGLAAHQFAYLSNVRGTGDRSPGGSRQGPHWDRGDQSSRTADPSGWGRSYRVLERRAVAMAVGLAPTLAMLGLLVSRSVSLVEFSGSATTGWGWPLAVVIDAHDGHRNLIDPADTLRLGSFGLNTGLWALLLLYIRGVTVLIVGRLEPRQFTAAAVLAPVPLLWLVAAAGYNIGRIGDPVEWVIISAAGGYGGTLLVGLPLAHLYRRRTRLLRIATIAAGVAVGGGVALAALPGFGLLGCVIGALSAAHFLQIANSADRGDSASLTQSESQWP